jgi:hypothetical protein
MDAIGGTMLSEVSQDQKYKRYMFFLILKDRSKDKHTQNQT